MQPFKPCSTLFCNHSNFQSLACDCDSGYGTYDCSERMCPYGVDPLHIDDENTARIPSWVLHFEDSNGIDGTEGTWRLKFYDVFGEDWVTELMNLNSTCSTLTSMLEAIPNDVVDEGTVDCRHQLTTDAAIYRLEFTGNPGYHKIPEIVVLDEAGRHTLKRATETAYNGLDTTVVYDSGITGEFYDYFGKKCGVTISITDISSTDVFGAVQTATMVSGTVRTLKTCLGDSNGVDWDNVGVENWDYGATTAAYGSFGDIHTFNDREAYPNQYPHLVKLVDTAADSEFDGGVYTIMYWNTEDETFYLSSAVDTSAQYQV